MTVPGVAAREEGRWAGRTVVVTGSTSGIGRATAELFLAGGAHVVFHGLPSTVADDLPTAGSGGQSLSVVLSDLRLAESAGQLIDHAVRQTGRLDVLVNNAGANVFRGALEASLEDWDSCLAVDLRAVWLCSAAAARVMSPGSAIVNVSSNHATATLSGAFPYNVAKAGVLALSQSLAIELAERGIRVNTVCPGYVDTPINDAYFATFDDPGAARRRAEQLHLLRRLGSPAEVAHAITFLADDRTSGFTTGTTLTVDGGRSTLLQDPPPHPAAGRSASLPDQEPA